MSDTKKKSFVFYIEWQEVLMEYPAEVRLEVYDAIIEYVASGTLSELKPLAKMAFSFIKKQIDSNNDKYNSLVEKRREAGKKGMANRYSGEKSTNDNKANTSYQDVTKLTNDNNTNYNVPDNVPDINNSLSNARDGILDGNPVNSNFEQDLNLTECRRELLANQSWINQLSMNVHSVGYSFFTEDVCREYIDRYFMELQNRGIERKSVSDATSHFSNWLKIELKKQKDNDTRGATAFRTHSGASKQGTEKEARRNGHIPDSTDARKDYSGHF